jgi:hypothetical protein
MTTTIPCPNCRQPLEVTLAASTNYDKTKQILDVKASALTNEELNKHDWRQSQKRKALSTILLNETTLADPILKLLFDRLSASSSKSWKLGKITYKLSQNNDGTLRWLQRWTPL